MTTRLEYTERLSLSQLAESMWSSATLEEIKSLQELLMRTERPAQEIREKLREAHQEEPRWLNRAWPLFAKWLEPPELNPSVVRTREMLDGMYSDAKKHADAFAREVAQLRELPLGERVKLLRQAKSMLPSRIAAKGIGSKVGSVLLLRMLVALAFPEKKERVA